MSAADRAAELTRQYEALVSACDMFVTGIRSDLKASTDVHPLVRVHAMAQLLRASGTRVDLVAAFALLKLAATDPVTSTEGAIE